ncbi:glycerophosphoryl diester phosphodiesterase membrane domain-containing protein [Frankia sp. EI5c]|uniref:glycerophosphoryl diester phosphodiesterase membrane domain-containing protein n=1 Tax=Frankia sp. EI5c TaxID=683316 RepID=UPI0021013088|nr:glycerophosphoryl diester phosphodiesterase membrane domain-containing protein [Frankia sp. EI5c]
MLTLVVTLLSVLGLIALIVGAVVVAVFLSLASPAYVLEGQTIRAALRRSRNLVRGSWWRTFGIMLLSALIAFVLMGVATFVTTGILLASDSFGDPIEGDLTVAGHVVNAIGTLIGTTFATPILSGTIVLLYVDQRIRREALDVTLTEAARQRAANP